MRSDTSIFPILPAGKKGKFLANPCLQQYQTGFDAVYDRTFGTLREKGITVNAADPGIVSTDIITMHQWFDPLTDIFFRPFIRTPKKGASTAVGLLLDEAVAGVSGQLYASSHRKQLSEKYLCHVQQKQLWQETEQALERWLK